MHRIYVRILLFSKVFVHTLDPRDTVYDPTIKRLKRGDDVVIDAGNFTVTQLMMLARAAHAHEARLRIVNGPFRVEDAMAIRRAGRGHVSYVGPHAA
ncbi:hypothetical protein [Longibacter sp.]|uniref:hypothetical protein n=1 Tax=Longibacter sp. TaxID=2045415 RepID=UPI003EB8E48D